MVKWKPTSGKYVENRRGQRATRQGGTFGLPTGGSSGGGGGLGGGGLPIGKLGLPIIILIVVLSVCMGGGGTDSGTLNPSAVPTQTETPTASTSNCAEESSQQVQFMCAITDNTQDIWTRRYAAAGETYTPTKLVFFDGFTNSGCGGADAKVGPHYCPLDQTMYLDLGFFDVLKNQFGASGDFAQAYVIAHEVGHHVQTLEGINEAVRRAQQNDPANANALSVAMELQADCFAGIWARDANQLTDDVGAIELEIGDLQEGIAAAEAVGDDRIQQASTGRIDPEQWTHGSAEQRADWFLKGYNSGDLAICDTFGG